MSIPESRILETRVHALTYESACQTALRWAAEGASKYICVATVNNVMEAHDSQGFKRVMNEADIVTPDGMPLVWGLKLLGNTGSYAGLRSRPDAQTARAGRARPDSRGLLWGSPQVLDRLLDVVLRRFPTLHVAYAWSPPFRPLTLEEDEQVTSSINEAGARILFIGLNTPKQDYWMAAHRGACRPSCSASARLSIFWPAPNRKPRAG